MEATDGQGTIDIAAGAGMNGTVGRHLRAVSSAN